MSRKNDRAKPLDRQTVLTEALRFADEHGIETLSMRKLGQRLGVEAMSLYNHVRNKDDILDAIVDLVVGQIQIPTLAKPWRAAMHRRAVSAHEALMRHSWATMLIVSRPNLGPNMLRYVNATIGCLVEAGFTYPLADHAWNAIDSYVYGFTLQKLNFPFQPEEYSKVAQQFLPQIPVDQYPYLNRLSQEVIARRHDGIHQLEFGLSIVLDGLEELLNA